MITYNPAFDLYHSIFRMAHIIRFMDDDECLEIDKVRIWDFYILFPDKVHNIHLKQKDKELRDIRKNTLKKLNNPYEYQGDNHKLFEWIKPAQVSALNCLVSCGILDKEKYLSGRVCISNRSALTEFINKAGELSERERNALKFLRALSRFMPLTGPDGLKKRTELLEYRYDA